MMADRIGNLLPASPGSSKSREAPEPAFAEDERRFRQMFEDDLKNYRQREKEQMEARQASAEEEEEQMLRASETAEQIRRSRSKEKQERLGLKKEEKTTAKEKTKTETEASGKQDQQDAKVKAEDASQKKGSETDADTDANKTSKVKSNTENKSGEASKNAPKVNTKIPQGLVDAKTADDADPDLDSDPNKTSTQSGKGSKTNGTTLNANPGGGKSAMMASEKLSGTSSGQDQGKETKVNSQTANTQPVAVDSGKTAAPTEETSKAQNQQKPEALLQEIQKNSTAKKAEGKMKLVSKAVQDSKNIQTAQKSQAKNIQVGNNEEKEGQPIRLFSLGSERRPVKMNSLVDRAEFVRLLASDKQSQQSGVSANMSGKIYTADAEIKVQDGGTSASDNNEQQKEFKFSLNSNISSANDTGSVKRKVAQKLVNLIRQQQVHKNQQTEMWQKHRFVLDDGKAIHVASRNAEGLLTLQLGVQNQELNKLIQQHLQEIKAHLQEQFGMEIDVQLQNSEQQGDSEFDKEQADGEHLFSDATLSETDGIQSAERQTLRIRDLGFNTNEWIA